MDLITPLVTGVLLAVFTGLQTWINVGRFGRVDSRLDQLASEIATLRSETRAELASVRSDLMQVALAVGARSGPQAG